MARKKNKGGRPTKYTETVVRKLEGAFALGCTVTEAALFAGISRQSLYEWMQLNQGFSDRIEELRARPFLAARKVIVEAILRCFLRSRSATINHGREAKPLF